MNGLRMYIVVPSDAPEVQKIFFSRRGDGPYYRWSYQEDARKWTVSRVISHDAASEPLCLATWKTIPLTLQTRLGEHYAE